MFPNVTRRRVCLNPALLLYKAPSGRELSSECETEGERVNIDFSICEIYAGSFHRYAVPLPPGGRQRFETPRHNFIRGNNAKNYK